jgi:hypothetical protein
MKQIKNLFAAVLIMSAMVLSGCLHIIEDVTFRSGGTGTYKMTLDMSEMKGMMDMMKTMVPDSVSKKMKDSTAILDHSAAAPAPAPDNGMSQMGQQLSSVTVSLKGVEGITNVVEVNDTANFKFGYSFDFSNINALNRALRIINKDKFESKTDDIYKYSGNEFERMATGDIGAELKKALAENSGEEQEGAGNADMIKSFFADMSYKTVYHFPDQTIKKNSNDIGELSDDKHSLTIMLKPFDEEQQKKKVSIAAKLKLK